MAFDGERSLLILGSDRLRASFDIALAGNAVLFAVAVGVGLLDESWCVRTFPSWIDIHVLFATCLCAFVIAKFHGRVTAPMRAPELRENSRHLSRMVYLALYLVIGGKQLIAMVSPLRQDSTLACATHNCGIFQPVKDCKAILVGGVVALLVIRIMTLRHRLRRSEE